MKLGPLATRDHQRDQPKEDTECNSLSTVQTSKKRGHLIRLAESHKWMQLFPSHKHKTSVKKHLKPGLSSGEAITLSEGRETSVDMPATLPQTLPQSHKDQHRKYDSQYTREKAGAGRQPGLTLENPFGKQRSKPKLLSAGRTYKSNCSIYRKGCPPTPAKPAIKPTVKKYRLMIDLLSHFRFLFFIWTFVLLLFLYCVLAHISSKQVFITLHHFSTPIYNIISIISHNSQLIFPQYQKPR